MQYVMMSINHNSIIFTDVNKRQFLNIDIGYQTLIENHFKGALPTPYETEMAIMTIEEAIENTNVKEFYIDTVHIDKKHNRSIVDYFNHEKIIEIQQVEDLFNRVADVISGSPKHQSEFPDTLEFIAVLFILRELMHHLNIKSIRLD